MLSRLGVGIVFVLSGAYATFPWWAPTGAISRQIADELSRQMGVAVRIEGMTLSWFDGVEIRDLTICSSDRFGSAPLATVRSIRTELSPVELFVHRRMAWMELVRPRVFVRLGADGDVNLQPLTRLRQDVAIDRINVYQGQATVQLHDDPRLIAMKVPSLQFDAGHLREITMSASLVQSQEVGEAPVSLSPGAWSDPTAAASASLTFSNVDLGQLPVAALGILPVRRLAGLCDGAVDVKVTHDGVLESLGFRVRVRGLDVQPAGAGTTLPVIDEAHLRIQAAYDHLTHCLHLRSVSVRLPGVDLSGQGKVFAEVFEGHWEAIESLDLRGKVYPARLTALLTGEAALGGGLAVSGPVDVTVSAQRQGTKLRLRLGADADAAEVRRGPAILKPAGRLCHMGLGGDLDHRTSAFIVNESFLDLAGNRFSGHGALVSLRRFTRRLAGRRERGIGETVLSELARLDWRGSWEIGDLGSLQDLFPPAGGGDVLGAVRLRGPLTGRWFVHHAPATRVHVSFQAPGGTELAVGEHFAKPAGVPLHLDIDTGIDPNGPALEDLDLSLSVGSGRLGIDRARLVFGDPNDPNDGPEFAGRVTIEGIEGLLPSVTAAGDLAPRLRGGLTGQLAADLAPRRRRVRLSADLKDTQLALGPWFDKPGGREANVHVDLRSPVGAGQETLLACTWASPPGLVTVNCTFPRLAGVDGVALGDVTWRAEAEVHDAAKLLASSRALAEAVGEASVSGPVKVTAGGTLRGRRLDGHVFCDATDLVYTSSAGVRRNKGAGTGLTVRLAGSLARDKGVLVAEARRCAVRFAGSSALAVGTARIRTDELTADGGSVGRALGEARLDANASLVAEEALWTVAPELGRLARRYGVSGRCYARLRTNLDANALHSEVSVDGTALAIAKLPALAGMSHGTKPAGMAVKLDLDASCPRDLSRVVLGNLRLRVGAAQLVADARADVVLDRDELPAALGKVSAHLALSTGPAEDLVGLVPALKPYRLSGQAFVDVDLSDVVRGEVSCATVHFDRFTCRVRGKDVALDGEALFEKLTAGRELPLNGVLDPNDRAWAELLAGGSWRIGRLRTDGLAFRAGTSRGWLLADLCNLPRAPTGSFHVLAETLDLDALSTWATGTPHPARATYKLTPSQVDAVRRQGQALAAAARKHLASATIEGRVSVGRFRTYDASVHQAYELRRLELTASVAEGRVKVAYVGGLNGGLLSDSYAVDLARADSPVTCESRLRNVLAEENIQPQLAKFFPGNTVTGTFSRRERVSVPLVDALACAIDPRYPRRAVGTGKTVAIGGTAQGRAAPTFITKIFPGLNLAKYPYRKMTAFAEFRTDGTAKNDMVFSGKTYDLYMEGTTDADSIGRYEIGLILLGTPQSAEWNHTYRQGRIPLLNFKARIEGGKMHDEEVSYLWPNETLFVIFLKNNIFYRIWLAAGRNRGL